MNVSSVAVIGSVTIDTIEHNGRSVCQLGGVTTYAGLTFRRHGIDTVIVSNVAERDQSILDILTKEGISISVGKTEMTTRFINHVDDCYRWQEMPHSAEPIKEEQIKKILDSFDHIHVGALHPDDISQGVLHVLSTTQKVISIDVQGFVRYRDRERIINRVSDMLASALSVSRFVKADETELETILQAYKMNCAELIQTFDIDEIVVTRGSRGGYVRDLIGHETHYPAQPASVIQSTVGAGDVFFAAYLVHHIYRNDDIKVSCGHAAHLVAKQIEGQYIKPETLRLNPIFSQHIAINTSR
jgi:sugar/nucleoside kinase (ribokinase family)